VSLVIVLAAVGVTMAWWFFAVGMKTVAENALVSEQKKRDDLTEQLATYSYVLDAQGAHQRVVAAEAWVTSRDVRWDSYVDQILDALPQGVVGVTQIEVQQVSPAAGALESAGGPFDEADLGTIGITGVALAPQLANDYVAKLATISGLYHVEIVDMRLDTLQDSEIPVWLFTLTMDISLEALSGRSIFAEGSAK
jgi:hypothetical protein